MGGGPLLGDVGRSVSRHRRQHLRRGGGLRRRGRPSSSRPSLGGKSPHRAPSRRLSLGPDLSLSLSMNLSLSLGLGLNLGRRRREPR